MSPPPFRVIRRRPPSPPVYLLDVLVEHGGRTHARGVLWDGLLNATPEDDTDGPSPVEALLAALGACFVRNLRWMADGAHVEFTRIALKFAAKRDDNPPALSGIRIDVELTANALPERVIGVVEQALRSGTITRTVGRAVPLDVVVRINGESAPVRIPEWNGRHVNRPKARDRDAR